MNSPLKGRLLGFSLGMMMDSCHLSIPETEAGREFQVSRPAWAIQ